MSNAEFFLLMQALGFSSAEEIHRYIGIKKFRGFTTISSIQTWLDGSNQGKKIIPSDVIEHFSNLHADMVKQSSNPYYLKKACLYIYKDDQEMWDLLPHLKGYPRQYLINLYVLLVLKHGHLNFRFYRPKLEY